MSAGSQALSALFITNVHILLTTGVQAFLSRSLYMTPIAMVSVLFVSYAEKHFPFELLMENLSMKISVP